MNPAPPPSADRQLLRIGLGLLLAVATLGVYWQSLDYELLSWDDDQHITHNPYFDPITPSNLVHFLFYSHLHLYIPISYWFYAFEVWLSGFFPSANPAFKYNPVVFHAGNLVVHLACVLLAYRLLFRLVRNAPAALVGALLFSLHPLQVESACWVGESRGTLSTFLSFLAVWYYLNYAGVDPQRGIFATAPYEPPQRRRRDYWYAFAFYVGAMLAKPSATSLPLLLAAIDLILLRRDQTAIDSQAAAACGKNRLVAYAKRLWNPTLRRLAFWFFAAAVVTGFTKFYQRSELMYGPAVAPVLKRPFVAGDAYAFYLVKLVWPVDLAFDHGRTPHYVMEQSTFYWAWLLPVLVGVALWLCPRRRIWLGCYAIFIVSILPVSGVVPFLFQSISTVADRYMYVPMFGFGLMAAAWIATRPRPGIALAGCMFVVGVLSYRAYDQCKYWRNDFTFYHQGLKVTPHSFMAHHSLGHSYRLRGDHEQAIAHYRAVLPIRPDYSWANYYCGLSLVELKRYDEALTEYRAGLQTSPSLMELHIALADLLALTGDDHGAEVEYIAATNSAPDDHRARVVYGEFLLRRKRFAEGDEQFRIAKKLKPDNAETESRHGRALLEAEGGQPTWDRCLQAEKILAEAVRLDPRSAQAHSDLAGCYCSLYALRPDQIDFGNRAIEQAREASRIDPNLFAGHYNLGLAFKTAGDPPPAIDALNQAAKLVPPGSKHAADVRKLLDELRPPIARLNTEH